MLHKQCIYTYWPGLPETALSDILVALVHYEHQNFRCHMMGVVFIQKKSQKFFQDCRKFQVDMPNAKTCQGVRIKNGVVHLFSPFSRPRYVPQCTSGYV